MMSRGLQETNQLINGKFSIIKDRLHGFRRESLPLVERDNDPQLTSAKLDMTSSLADFDETIPVQSSQELCRGNDRKLRHLDGDLQNLGMACAMSPDFLCQRNLIRLKIQSDRLLNIVDGFFLCISTRVATQQGRAVDVIPLPFRFSFEHDFYPHAIRIPHRRLQTETRGATSTTFTVSLSL